MLNIAHRLVWVSILCGSVMACTTMEKTKDHQAICKELRHQIIWNGANGDPITLNGGTGNQMQATQQLAQTETLEKNYHDEGCM